jgi:peptidyl-tRNA hydrolase
VADKLYLVARGDLPPGARASQLAHAMAEAWAGAPDQARRWFGESNTVVLLEVPDEPALRALSRKLSDRVTPHLRVFEPDLDDAMTALAVVAPPPPGRTALRKLPLAFARG